MTEKQSFQHGRSVPYTLTRVRSLVAAFSTMFNDSPAGRCHRCRLNYRAINSDCRNNSWHFSYPTCSLLNPFFCRSDRPPQKRKFVVHLVTTPHLPPPREFLVPGLDRVVEKGSNYEWKFISLLSGWLYFYDLQISMHLLPLQQQQQRDPD